MDYNNHKFFAAFLGTLPTKNQITTPKFPNAWQYNTHTRGRKKKKPKEKMSYSNNLTELRGSVEVMPKKKEEKNNMAEIN